MEAYRWLLGEPENGYVRQDALIDALAEEVTGGQKVMTTEARILQDQLDQSSPTLDLPEPTQAAEPQLLRDGFSVDPTSYRQRFGGDADAQIREDVHNYLAQRGYLDYLSRDQYDGLMRAMRDEGGSPEDYLDRITEEWLAGKDAYFKAKEAEDGQGTVSVEGNDGPAQGSVGRAGRAAAEPRRADGAPARSAADDGLAPTAVFEATDAGEQALIPGVEPVTQRQRLEAAQGAPMRGGNAPTDAGLFDVSGRSQADIFDDINSPEAIICGGKT